MRQVFWCHNHEENGNKNNTQTFASPVGHDMFWGEDLPDGRHPWLVAGTFLNMRVEFDSASDVQWTYRLIVNGVASALLVVVPVGTTAMVVNTTDSVAVSVGDSIALRRDPLPGFSSKVTSWHPNFYYSIEFDSTNANESGYGTNGVAFFTGSGSWYFGLFGMGDGPLGDIDACYNLVGPPGDLTSYSIHTDDSPEAEGSPGDTCTYVIVVDGVVQDGSGATVDTQIVLSTTNTGTWTGTLPLTSGQLVTIRERASGFSSNDGLRTAIGVKFVATTDGQFWVGGTNQSSPLNTVVSYQEAVSTPRRAESFNSGQNFNSQLIGAITTVTLTGLWVRIEDPPAAGNSWTFGVNVNLAPVGPTVVIADSQTANNTPTGSFTVGLGDIWSFTSTPFSTPSPTSDGIAWVFIGAVIPTPGVGSLVVVKVTSNGDTTTEFPIAVGGGLSPADILLVGGGQQVYTDVPEGDGYSVEETPPVGWTLVSAVVSNGSPIDDISIAEDETVIVTLTNSSSTGTIIVQKVIPAGDDGTEFPMIVGGGLSPSELLLGGGDSHTYDAVVAGDGYSIEETPVPMGWSLVSIVISNGSPAANISVGVGELVIVTLTNRPPVPLGAYIRRWLRRAPHVIDSGTEDRLFHSSFELWMETGVGNAAALDPQVMFRWSNDAGHLWGTEYWRSCGAQGAYQQRLRWLRLGQARDRVYEVSGSDPVKIALLGAEVDVQKGRS